MGFKKARLKPRLKTYWRIPSGQNAAFVAAVEDVLEVYSRAYHPAKPAVCMSEKPFQLPGEVRRPITMKPGVVEKVDREYKREGAAAFSFSRSRLPAGGTRKRLNTEPGRIGRIG
jgi:hypothetical protein